MGIRATELASSPTQFLWIFRALLTKCQELCDSKNCLGFREFCENRAMVFGVLVVVNLTLNEVRNYKSPARCQAPSLPSLCLCKHKWISVSTELGF